MKPHGHGEEGRVSDEELAEIARQLRGVIGEAEGALPRPVLRRRRPRASEGTVILRFAGGFVLPGLMLVAVLLISHGIAG